VRRIREVICDDAPEDELTKAADEPPPHITHCP
jgi:hypothetical protein